MKIEHTFETTKGYEIDANYLRNATWRVTETFVDVDNETDTIVFTHRVINTNVTS